MNSFIKKFFALLFPAKCIECRKEGNFICEKDLREIPKSARPDKNWIVCVWNYKDPRIKKLLWMLKFEHKFAVAEDLGQTLFDNLFEEILERSLFENNKEPVLVPIPLSIKSLRKRGYNQTEIIARSICEKSDGRFRIEKVLAKTKETATQHSIKNRSERLRNLHGAFKTRENFEIKGKNFVLIDDITTTHGTLVEARRTLLASGARSVIAFTIAH